VRAVLRDAAVGLGVLLALTLGAVLFATWMPGASFDAAPPALSAAGQEVRDNLAAHVRVLAGEIGERNLEHLEGLNRARDYAVQALARAGYATRLQTYTHRGESYANVEAVRAGRRDTAVIVGAHYDSVLGSPGANDNASGVAVLLELARLLRDAAPEHTLRFVAFTNEEPPYFDADEGMGSAEYAAAIEASPASVAAMLSLETLGVYRDAPGSQTYPVPPIAWLYPDRGDFVAFIANPSSSALVRRLIGSFRAAATIPSQGAVLPAAVPGVAWSDHSSFWRRGVPAVMVTDTALFRDEAYHRSGDLPDRLDYERMARVVLGLEVAIRELAQRP